MGLSGDLQVEGTHYLQSNAVRLPGQPGDGFITRLVENQESVTHISASRWVIFRAPN
jgi:hypothetical protein